MYRNVVRTTVRAFTDRDLETKLLKYTTPKYSPGPPSFFRRFIRRFLLGLPVVGAGAVVQMLSSLPLGFHWFRWRSRRNTGNSRDIATLLFVAMVLIGAARCVLDVYVV